MNKNTPKSKAPKYDAIKAGIFWTRRLRSTNPLAAVLTYNAPPELNRAYDEWERNSLFASLPSNLKGKRILDLGSGVGRLAIPLAKRGAEVVAVDPSDGMRRHLMKASKKAGVEDSVVSVSASADQIPFGDKLFDAAICFGVLEHLPEQARIDTLRELARVVGRRGSILLVVNNFENQVLRDKYHLQSQRKDGYFVTLVGIQWLKRQCARMEMKMEICAANPFYALAHYYLHPHVKAQGFSRNEFIRLCRDIPTFDSTYGLSEPLCRRIASHYMVRVVRK